VTLDEPVVEALLSLLESNESKTVSVDLQLCRVEFPDGSVHAFKMDEARRDALLQGLDPITVAENHEEDIATFQQRDRHARPWIWFQGS
jgi:3-isopropylmalate/(R)-2-methylmalate dehydratase small subunit